MWPWPLTLVLLEQMFQIANLLIMENNCANLYRNPSKIVGVMVQTKNWLSGLAFGLWPTRTNISNGSSTCDGELLCHINLKSIHNCRSYSPDKFAWIDEWTHKRRHIPRTVLVTIMSHSPPAGLTNTMFYLFGSETVKYRYICEK